MTRIQASFQLPATLKKMNSFFEQAGFEAYLVGGAVRDMLMKQPDLTLIKQSDYIECPKESGYRSLHLVMEIPVYLSKTEHHVRVEIQLRTIAMDFWASLEHQLHYKNDAEVPDSIRRELFRVAETIAMTDREMEEIAIELQALD